MYRDHSDRRQVSRFCALRRLFCVLLHQAQEWQVPNPLYEHESQPNLWIAFNSNCVGKHHNFSKVSGPRKGREIFHSQLTESIQSYEDHIFFGFLIIRAYNCKNNTYY